MAFTAELPAGPDLVVRRARLLDLVTGSVGPEQDLHVVNGRVARSSGSWAGPDVDLEGGIVMPGLWDAHVHLGQWALRQNWVDLSPATSARHAASLLREALADRPADQVLVGYGFRDSRWPDAPSDQVLADAVSDRPVVAMSGDMHAVWATHSALARLGLDHSSGHLVEEDAFEVHRRVNTLPDEQLDALVTCAGREAAARGVVGVVDLEMVDGVPAWQRRFEAGFDSLAVRTGIYPQWLPAAVERGLRSGDLLDDLGLLAVGPLKVIVDGSLTARTAWCSEPYAASTLGAANPDHPCGLANVEHDDLVHLMSIAAAQGLECAIHAIGDAAVSDVLDAFAETGASGSIEHAQLVTDDDITRMADLGLRASVQPAHLLDDRAAMDDLWPGRTRHAFPLASMARAGVRLSLGSDAPVAPLDPWLAIESAVLRSDDKLDAWHPEQALSLSQALVASCRGVSSLVAGAEADLIVLDENPFDIDPDRLHRIRPRMTMLAGRVTAQA
ncbi:amidohydrolase [Aestuariimicrobium ganziense]|uniref:amidohydrolase n=1 Tax=Aestuariimicrobium ganziense TaxID=2773677 RepID=UPI001943853E|nr:amidohydrolase family protein [Aestuariimicrobium ganziense]